jgi:hypothetical protein
LKTGLFIFNLYGVGTLHHRTRVSPAAIHIKPFGVSKVRNISDQFQLADIVVIERENEQSQLKKLKSEEKMVRWLND